MDLFRDIPGFNVELLPEQLVLVARIVGQVNPADFPRAELDLRRLVGQGYVRVVLDLSRAEGLSSASLGLLAFYQREFSARGGGLAVVNPHGVVARNLERAALDRLFPCYPTVEAAVRALTAPPAPPAGGAPPRPR